MEKIWIHEIISFMWKLNEPMKLVNLGCIMRFCTMICQKIISCCIFHLTNYMLCTLVCAFGVKLDICNRWLHFWMDLPRSKMLLMQKNKLVGALELYLFMASWKLQILLGVWQHDTKQLLVGKLANVIWGENWDA